MTLSYLGSNYFSVAQSPTSNVVMKINGLISPMVTFGDGQMQVIIQLHHASWIDGR